MKKTILALLAISASALAFAGNDSPGNCGQGSGSGNGCLPSGSTTTTTTNKNSAKSRSNSASFATGGSATAKGGEGGSASTGAISNTSSAEGGSNALTVNEASHRASASTAAPPTIFPTANCTVASSFGLQGMSFGIAGGAATIDASCEAIEQAKAAQALGQSEVAREVLCALPRIREARRHTGSPCFADTPAGIASPKTEPPQPSRTVLGGTPD